MSRRWLRRTRTRAELARDEWLDRTAEWRDRAAQMSIERASAAANRRLEESQERWRRRTLRFDDWFNDRWELARKDARNHIRNLKSRLTESAGDNRPPPLDFQSAMLIGAGVGGALQGYMAAGVVIAGCGALRASRRFVVGKLDAGDCAGLFRFAPEAFKRRKGELFVWLHNELASWRRLKNFGAYQQEVDLSSLDNKDNSAMNPELDYTPERLFEDAMKTVAAHPRVRECLGEQVQPVSEPEKVVYRIHEGISEVYMAWPIAGKVGTAELQVKATASLLDFIYIFPEETASRFAEKPEGFVIRPNDDNWSANMSELPKYMKQPFGKHNGRLYHNREGIFDWDYTVRDFRHGWEGGKKRGYWT